ncbi:MAG: hypothetical protein ACQPRJ_04300 [Solitalea-like symbiont of Acarus siro]
MRKQAHLYLGANLRVPANLKSMKNKLTPALVLTVTMAVFTTLSCQKNEGLISEKQAGKSDNAEIALSSAQADNLVSGNLHKNTGVVDWNMQLPEFTRIEFNKENGDYNLSINFKGLDYDSQFLDKEYGFHVAVWDSALQDFWSWDKNLVIEAKVDEATSSVQAKIPGQKMFANKGTGRRELDIYLSSKSPFGFFSANI